MDYKKHYSTLIYKGQTRLLEGYSENHHIVPRCMGGTDDPQNLVLLTPEEHYVAHQLLVKIYPNNPGLLTAALAMTMDTHGYRSKNKFYGWLRRQYSDSRKGKPAWNKGRIGKHGWYTDGTEQQFCIIGEQPEEWTRGRTPGRSYSTPRKTARSCGLKKYVGEKCPEGHNLRYVSTGQCVGCMTV